MVGLQSLALLPKYSGFLYVEHQEGVAFGLETEMGLRSTSAPRNPASPLLLLVMMQGLYFSSHIQ